MLPQIADHNIFSLASCLFDAPTFAKLLFCSKYAVRSYAHVLFILLLFKKKKIQRRKKKEENF